MYVTLNFEAGYRILSMIESASEESECFPFFSIPCMTQSLMFYQDLDCQSQERKWKSKLITRPEIEHYDLFLLLLLLLLLFPTLSEKCSFHLIISDRVLSRITVLFLTGLIFTRSYCSVLLIRESECSSVTSENQPSEAVI